MPFGLTLRRKQQTTVQYLEPHFVDLALQNASLLVGAIASSTMHKAHIEQIAYESKPEYEKSDDDPPDVSEANWEASNQMVLSQSLHHYFRAYRAGDPELNKRVADMLDIVLKEVERRRVEFRSPEFAQAAVRLNIEQIREARDACRDNRVKVYHRAPPNYLTIMLTVLAAILLLNVASTLLQIWLK